MSKIGNLKSDSCAIDNVTMLHSWRTSFFASSLAMVTGTFTAAEIAKIKDLALLHDIGKCKIPSCILNKAGGLSDDEYKIIKKHPVYSQEILESYGYNKKDLFIIRAHHEKLDGSGYPDGLTKKQIPLETQIITIADIYDALTSKREYRINLPGLKYDHNHAIKIMKNMQGLNLELITEFNAVLQTKKWVRFIANPIFV